MSAPEAGWRSVSSTRSYRPQGAQAILGVLCGMIFLVFGLISVWQMTSWLGALFAIFGAYILLSNLASRLILRDDAIETYTLFRARTIRRDAIRGWRRVRHRSEYNSPPQIVFELLDGTRARISRTWTRNPDLNQWLVGLPDLDAQDRAASLRQIAADPEIGATPEDRLTALQRAKTNAILLNGAAIAAMLWAVVYPHPYAAAIAVLLLLPVLASFCALASPGLYRLYAPRTDAHANLLLAFLMPSITLVMCAADNYHVLDWNRAWAPLLVGGIALFVLALTADAGIRDNPSGAAILLLFSLPYGIGAGLELNAAADRAPAQIYSTHVISMRAYHGRHSSYHLSLQPWGPVTAPSSVSVPYRFYSTLHPGDTVCIGLHPGGLGFAWYTVKRCGED